MAGYIRIREKLAGRWAWGPILIILLVPAQTLAQAQTAPPGNHLKSAKIGSTKKHAEKTFVLLGAGDIASCKNPEGARATAKLIEQIPGTVFAATWPTKEAAPKISRIVMSRPGDASKTGQNQPWEIMSMGIIQRQPISNIGGRGRGQWARATIATTWETGTLWC